MQWVTLSILCLVSGGAVEDSASSANTVFGLSVGADSSACSISPDNKSITEWLCEFEQGSQPVKKGERLLTYEEALRQLNSIPFSESWRTSTLDVLTTALENYAFLDKAKNIGPPYFVQVDLLRDLIALKNRSFTSDFEFQEAVTSIIGRLSDSHTRYFKPLCYSATWVLPFAFHVDLHGFSQRVMLVPSTVTERYLKKFPAMRPALNKIMGKFIMSIDGLETMTALSEFAYTDEVISNDIGAAFNHAMRTFGHREVLLKRTPPAAELKVMLYDESSFTFPWMLVAEKEFGDIKACLATHPAAMEQASKLKRKSMPRSSLYETAGVSEHLNSVNPIPLTNLVDTVVLPGGRSSTISCWTSRTGGEDSSHTSGAGITLVMAIKSFSPELPGGTDLERVKLFIDDAMTCLETPHELMVIDVMQNGGGVVCLGYRLVELLVNMKQVDGPYFPMDIKHSALMDRYIAAGGVQPFVNPEIDEGIRLVDGRPISTGADWYLPPQHHVRGGVLGNYSKKFTIDCVRANSYRPDARPFKRHMKHELLVLTDGTCGSTCSLFVNLLHERDLASFAGVGGIFTRPIDISSFDGGTVGQLEEMRQIAEVAGLSFPAFETSVKWQFTRFEAYSHREPDLPMQFVAHNAENRIAWWSFAWPSVGARATGRALGELYGTAFGLQAGIAAQSSIERAASLSIAEASSTHYSSDSAGPAITLAGIAAIAVMFAIVAPHAQNWQRGVSRWQTPLLAGSESTV